jgi:hypothetical protein
VVVYDATFELKLRLSELTIVLPLRPILTPFPLKSHHPANEPSPSGLYSTNRVQFLSWSVNETGSPFNPKTSIQVLPSKYIGSSIALIHSTFEKLRFAPILTTRRSPGSNLLTNPSLFLIYNNFAGVISAVAPVAESH